MKRRASLSAEKVRHYYFGVLRVGAIDVFAPAVSEEDLEALRDHTKHRYDSLTEAMGVVYHLFSDVLLSPREVQDYFSIAADCILSGFDVYAEDL